MRTLVASILGMCILGGVAGCAATQNHAADAGHPDRVVNTMCPIGKHEWEEANNLRPADLRREHKGTRIGFCCEHCVDAFDDMTDAEKEQVRRAALLNRPVR